MHYCNNCFVKCTQLNDSTNKQGQICWNPGKGLVRRNTHVKYQSSSTNQWKVISKFKIQSELQNDKQDKNNMPPIFDLRGIKPLINKRAYLSLEKLVQINNTFAHSYDYIIMLILRANKRPMATLLTWEKIEIKKHICERQWLIQSD